MHKHEGTKDSHNLAFESQEATPRIKQPFLFSKLKSFQKAIENMSFQVSASLTKIVQLNAEKNYTHRSANYHTSIWGDRYISYTSDSMVKCVP